MLSRLAPSSLTGRLVATVVTLVAVVSALVAAASVVGLNRFLTSRLDTQVDESLARAVSAWSDAPRAPSSGPSPAPSPEDSREDSSGGGGDGRDHPEDDHRVRIPIGQGAGTLTATFDSFGADGDVVSSTAQREPLTTAALDTLAGVPADGTVHAVDVPGFGEYRLKAIDSPLGKLVAGLPTKDLHSALTSMLVLVALFTLAAVAVAAVLGHLLVRRQLRPLRQVAATAHEVTELPLSSGEIGVTVRVPEGLTDPRTEVGQVGAALNTMLSHVEKALDARHRSEQQVRQFVADASHELRTPLSTIHGYAELSRRTPTGDREQLSQAMEKVEAEATRMSALVEDLLLLARLDAGRPLERVDVDVTKLVLEAVADARVVAPDHRWVLQLPEHPIVVTGDEQRLHQVLTNLLNNARRHTPSGTTVTVGARSENGQGPGVVVLTVHDDGPGMPDDLTGKAFERFTRGDSSRTRSSGGAGLGLSLVQAITFAHGGAVDVRSEPGSTEFSVRLPAASA